MAKVCDRCHQSRPLKGGILENRFGQYCADCLSTLNRNHNAGAAQSQRDADRDAHQRDIIQPWDRNGNPNPDFIREYPEAAKDYFNEGELKQYG